MVYHKITRADGTVLDSSSIMSFTFLDNVNDSTDLNPGSVCANSIVFTVWTDGATLQMTAGETLIAESSYCGRTLALGKYTTETPKKSSKNIYTITAYDNVSKLDVDVSSSWLKNVTFPISMRNFTESLLDHLGLELGACSLVNGSYMIQQFYSDGMTGRILLSWVAQANGCFVRADSSGAIAFGWYAQNAEIAIATEETDEAIAWVGTDGILLTNAGEIFLTAQTSIAHAYKQGSLSYEDYTVPSIDKVQITQTDDDVGVIRPTNATGTNALVVQSNLLLTTDTEANLAPVAQNLYTKLTGLTYKPCSVTITAMTSLRAGDIIHVTDINGTEFDTCITSITNSASGALVVSTGNSSRESVTAVNQSTYTNLAGRVLNIQTSVDGLKVEAADLVGQYASLDLTVDGLTVEVGTAQDSIADVAAELNSFSSAVESELTDLQSQLDGQITTWFYSYVPTTTNAPANEWTTEEERENHAGDLFYDDTTGYAYRWAYSSGAWTWLRISDVDVTAALATAQEAQDTADGKRRVFTATPAPPYDVGDLWSQGDDGDLLVCTTAKASGNYAAGDWSSSNAITTSVLGAVNASKLAFDAEYGLTITNGGIRILNATGTQVFGVDSSGYLELVGSIKGASLSLYQYSNGQEYFSASLGWYSGNSTYTPWLRMFRTDGSVSVNIVNSYDGHPNMALLSASGVATYYVGVDSNGNGDQYIRNVDGHTVFSVNTSSGGQPYLNLYNAEGGNVFHLYGDDNGNPCLYIKNMDGHNIFSIASDSNGNPSMGMRNSDGTMLLDLKWSALEWLPSLQIYTGNPNVHAGVISLTSSYYGAGTQLLLRNVYGQTYAVLSSSAVGLTDTGNYHDISVSATTTEQRWWAGGTSWAHMYVDSTGSSLYVTRLYVNGVQITR